MQTLFNKKLNKSFTLIELLIVIAILALLMSIIIITLNPSEMLKKSRDTKRISSLKALNNALGIFQATKPTTNMGTSSIVYISIPDSSSTCANLSLPTLPNGYTYQCSTLANYRKTDGTGWIPVNFDSLDIGSPISSLPIDPNNTTSTNLFFTYTTGGSWELNAILESSDNKLSGDNDKTSLDGGDSYSTYEIGTDLSLAPYKDTGLVGYWKFDKYTSGSIANNQTLGLEDSSGYGNNGTAINTNESGMTFVEGKRGGAINLDGTDDVINCGTNSSILPDAWTLTAWVKITGVSSEPLFYFSSTSTTPSVALEWAGTGRPLLYAGSSNYAYFVSSAWTSLYNSSDWKFIAFSLTGVSINDISNAKMYINDSIIAQHSVINSGDASTKTGCKIGGRSGDGFVQGQIDEVRLYNRVLTISEIKAIYEGTK